MPKVHRSGNSQARSSSNKELYKSRELSTSGRIIALVVGDALCFLIFASLGAEQHGEGFNLFYTFWVALPFIAGWFLVSPFLGAFKADVATRPSRMLTRTVLAWLASWPVAMGLRWLLVDRTTVPTVSFTSFLTFAMIALAFNLGLLLLWRWPFSLNNDLRKRGM